MRTSKGLYHAIEAAREEPVYGCQTRETANLLRQVFEVNPLNTDNAYVVIDGEPVRVRDLALRQP
jgi:hypothetical protein